MKTSMPHRLLLIDGVGAVVSIFFLGFVLVRLNDLVGIPINTLYILAAIPCFFLLFDIYSIFQKSVSSNLQIIAALNLAYCVLSVVLLIKDVAYVTTLGWVYIIGEVLIVAYLSCIEWRVGSGLANQS